MESQQQIQEEVLVSWFEKEYICDGCGTEWMDEWTCDCNDKCPSCNAEIEPTTSKDLSRPLEEEDFIEAANRLYSLGKIVKADPRLITPQQAKEYAEAGLEGTWAEWPQ